MLYDVDRFKGYIQLRKIKRRLRSNGPISTFSGEHSRWIIDYMRIMVMSNSVEEYI